MAYSPASLAAELQVSNFARSLRFYTDVLGFITLRFDAQARHAELEREGVSLTLRENTNPGADGASLIPPLGRGLILIVWVEELESLYAGVLAYGARLTAPLSRHIREEEGQRLGHLSFEIADPDGFALRFCQAMPPLGY